jgi:hypothetical protein
MNDTFEKLEFRGRGISGTRTIMNGVLKSHNMAKEGEMEKERGKGSPTSLQTQI